MARKLKCPECGTFNEKEEAIFHSGKYYCKICYENKKQSTEDYKNLIEYICTLFEIDAPNGWMLKQIKDFKDQFGYTYKGIKSTLYYFFDIQGNSINDCAGIGIVPFIYDEAKKFYIDKKSIKDNMCDCDVNLIQNTIQTIHIKRKDIKETMNYKKINSIDITKL